MKYFFYKFWAKWRDQIMIGLGVSAIVLLLMTPLIANKLSERDNPMELSSDEGIQAKSFEYKGHQYVLFEKRNIIRSSSIVHDPDCNKCKSEKKE